MALSDQQIDQFIQEGFVRIDHAFDAALAAEVRDRLWQDLPFDRADPATWTLPVVRLGMYSEPAFVSSANTPVLHEAFDQLVGRSRWIPRQSMGTFPVRFPSDQPPGDDGWHVDAAFPGDEPDNYLKWRVNVRSKGRALLMLFLYSDITVADAPTRIRSGSHLDVARLLSTAVEDGLEFMELASRLDLLPARPEVLATGPAGTVYLCHPFLVHAAQAHRGAMPRFLAQPALELKSPLGLNAGGDHTPVAQAIKLALGI
ncbi:phytanoyl-CoA dioxygenase [Dyadobacter sandarakinus]|uniref:Phytanoyl-CoA dioxygenase n=1 Tax=Dyadobacter sandarakinus TaxID=2747268 RepID=A0ABX7I439_9BACT|nr:phytanoyl-CoA dioxygenase [Dyadobacter sandarakinus]QRR00623.1 phytanoyl-CoA dioxygenase [Dyadobacter sandarakinus]